MRSVQSLRGMAARCLYWYVRARGTGTVSIKEAAAESGVALSSIYMAIKMNPGRLELRGSALTIAQLEQLEQPPNDPSHR